MPEDRHEIAPVEEVQQRGRGPLAQFVIRLLKEKPLGTIGAVIVLIVLLVAIFANLIAPFGMNEIHPADRLDPPSAQYLLGTDQLGRDLFSRIVYGARISVTVGLAGSAVTTLAAMIIGLISGFLGSKTDIIIQRFVDGWMCFPPMLIYLSVMALLGPGLWQVIFVLGITRGIRQSRIVRGAVIGIKENVYVEAARAIGASNTKILVRHILPNVLAPIITILAVSCGYMILSEATLSFLGFGVPPPEPTWGGMLSGSGRQYMYHAPWLALWPGVALASVVYGLNMFGDAVRDILDPRMRGGLGRYGGVKSRKPKEVSPAS